MDAPSLDQRLARLSPEQRASLERRLQGHVDSGAFDEGRIPPRPPGVEAPLSHGQQRFWLHQQFRSDSFANHEHEAYRISGPLDLDALRRSLDVVVARHDALRTTFILSNEAPNLVVQPPRPVELRIADWQPAEDTEITSELERYLADDIRRPFDLTRDLLLRVTLVRIGPDDHVLQFVFHHIAIDGWSISVLFRELSAVYAATVAGKPPALPDVPIQYPDFAVWQRGRLASGELAARFAYWREVLADSPLLDLPTDLPRPAEPTFHGARRRIHLSPELTAEIRAVGRRTGVTLFMTLLATLQVLLLRLSGNDDLRVGSPTADRIRPELAGAVGYFANLLVLRCDLSGDPTFRELLGRVREVTLAAFANADYPYGALVEELDLDRDASRNPLFQVMLALQTVPRRAFDLAPAVLTRLEVDPGIAKFDLSLYVNDESIDVDARGAVVAADSDQGQGRGSLELVLEFSLDLFQPATADRLLDQYQTLLQSVVEDPDQRISLLPLLSPAERRRVIVEWNRTEATYPGDRLIHQLFEDQVGRDPTALAVQSDTVRLTYRELDDRASRVRDHLGMLGVGVNDLVALLLDRSPDTLAAILGILKVGALYVPLDPTDPHERLAFMLDDARPRVVVTRLDLVDVAAGPDRPVVVLDDALRPGALKLAEDPISPGTAATLAYLLYTSGSTGRPKGVLGTHRGAVNRIAWMWGAFPFEPDDVCCQKTSLGFVDSVWELFGPLLAGVPSLIVGDEVVRDPRRLIDSLARHQVTRVVVVPSLLRAILDAEPALATRLPRLRHWVSSGEPLSRELVDYFQRLLPGRQLLNLYGSSEVAADVTCFDLANLRDEHVRVPIGRPIANTRIYILDPRGQPAPIGARGEIFVGGPAVAAGYLNRPELTAEKFVPDPFSDEPAARLFRTGDQARYLADGNVEYLGRLDQQVKIRGRRVELGELEATLRTCPGVTEAAVVVQDDEPDGQRLVAYVQRGGADLPSTDDVRQYLKRQLPASMLPGAIVVVDHLPLTSNGKVDRRALAALDSHAAESGGPQRSATPPRDLIELGLLNLWEGLLSARPIGVTDDFFELGGHSLDAVRLIDRIEKVFHQRLPLSTLLAASTIERLAEVLRQSGPVGQSSPLVPIQTGGTRPPLFLVHGIGGNVLRFRELAWYLGRDQSTYALQASEPGGSSAPRLSLEARAAEYLQAIRGVQPAGPYYLGGFSAGGLWALEMAQQLRAAGEEVALLVLLDTRFPWVARRLTFWARLRRDVAVLFAIEPRQRAAFALGQLVVTAREIGRKVRGRKPRPIPDSPTLRAFRELSTKHKQAIRRYAPARYAGSAVLFRSVLPDRAALSAYTADPYAPWRDLFGEKLAIVDVPGDHRTMLAEPHVRIVAETLRVHLDTAESERRAAASRDPS